MRTQLLYIASITAILAPSSLAQQTGADKPQKPAAKPAESAGTQTPKPADPTGKQADTKPADKAAELDIKLGTTTEAEKLLDAAITKIEGLGQFRTDVRQKTEMLGYTFTADGQYAIGPDYRMLYELRVQLTDTTGTIKEVCDGRVHWKNHKVFDEQQLTKMDLKKIREILDKPQFNKELRDTLMRRLGFSGIVPIMRGLRDAQKFDSFEEDTLDGKPVYILKGEWRPAAINQSSFRGQQLSFDNLPVFVPSQSTVWIGREDGWLHRLEMVSAKKVQGSRTKITLEFLNPQIGVTLPESLFVFEPPADVRVDDQTEIMYQNLNLVLQQTQSADRKAPASGTESAAGETDKSKAPPQ